MISGVRVILLPGIVLPAELAYGDLVAALGPEVEAVPKDNYYLFGKIVLRFDKELFQGSYSSKYDWQGNLIASYSAIRTNIVKVAPGELWGWAGGAVAVGINWKLDRATTAGIVAGQNVPADSRIPLSPNLFSLQSLMDKGR